MRDLLAAGMNWSRGGAVGDLCAHGLRSFPPKPGVKLTVPRCIDRPAGASHNVATTAIVTPAPSSKGVQMARLTIGQLCRAIEHFAVGSLGRTVGCPRGA